MVDSALVWIALVASFGVVAAVRSVRAYRRADMSVPWQLASLLVCLAGVLELGTANGYLAGTRAIEALSLLASVSAVLLLMAASWSEYLDIPWR